MYKVARDSSRPPPQPGAEAVAGPNPSRRDEEEIQFTPSEPFEEEQAKPEAHGIPEQSSAPKVIEAELARSDSDIEERIMERLKKSVPVAVVKAESEGLEDEEPPLRVNDDEMPRSNKKWWIIGVVALVLILGGVGAGVGVALSGGDDPPPPRPTGPPTKLEADICVQADDGTFICAQEGVPVPALMTVFFDCPSMQTENVFECVGGCAVIEEDNLQDLDENDRQCTGCMLCGTSQTVAYDCTNIAADEVCAFQDCSGDCGKGDPPSNSAETQADRCAVATSGPLNGTLFCIQDEEPTNAFELEFQDCPDTLGLNVFECAKCIVATVNEGIPGVYDEEDILCNGCLVCGSTIAFDCSNVAPNEPCAVTTCDGECVG